MDRQVQTDKDKETDLGTMRQKDQEEETKRHGGRQRQKDSCREKVK